MAAVLNYSLTRMQVVVTLATLLVDRAQVLR